MPGPSHRSASRGTHSLVREATALWDSPLTPPSDISADLLQAPLLHLEQELSLSCTICKRALRDCRAALVRDWASVKVTSSGSWFSHHPHAIALDHDLG